MVKNCLDRCFGEGQVCLTREKLKAIPADEVRRWEMTLLNGARIRWVSTRADAEKIFSEINFALMCEIVGKNQAERKAKKRKKV